MKFFVCRYQLGGLSQLIQHSNGKWTRIEPMYFLLNMVIFQPAMLVYQRVVNLKSVGVGHQLNNLPKKLVSTMRKKMFVLFLSQFEQLKVAIAHVKKNQDNPGGLGIS